MKKVIEGWIDDHQFGLFEIKRKTAPDQNLVAILLSDEPMAEGDFKVRFTLETIEETPQNGNRCGECVHWSAWTNEAGDFQACLMQLKDIDAATVRINPNSLACLDFREETP